MLEFTVPDRSRLADAVQTMTKLADGEPHVDDGTGVVSVGVGGSGSEALVQAVRALDEAGVETSGLGLRRPSLDDVFLALTGHAAEEEDLGGKRRRGRPKATETVERASL